MHFVSLVHLSDSNTVTSISTHLQHIEDAPLPPPIWKEDRSPANQVETHPGEINIVTMTPEPSKSLQTVHGNLPHTSIVHHAPGWTLFRNLYMSDGTLFLLSSNRSFPEFRLMISSSLPAENTPENIALREPTSHHMDYITPSEAQRRWGGETNMRVWTVEGNTVCLEIMCIVFSHHSRSFSLTNPVNF